jgi:squalene-hopene/tetraprenyl-beta-curcumene cyclase
MKRRQFLATTIAFGASAFTRAADEPLPRDGKNLSFRNEIRDSLNRSLVWLRAQQNADGSFGKDTLHPALTALPLVAFQREPTGRFAKEDFVAKGYAYLRGFTQPDGGIYSKENGLANYNTSVCLLARPFSLL